MGLAQATSEGAGDACEPVRSPCLVRTPPQGSDPSEKAAAIEAPLRRVYLLALLPFAVLVPHWTYWIWTLPMGAKGPPLWVKIFWTTVLYIYTWEITV